jgi:hypothetical protein
VRVSIQTVPTVTLMPMLKPVFDRSMTGDVLPVMGNSQWVASMTEWVYRRTGSSLVYHDSTECEYLSSSEGPFSRYRLETAEYWNNLSACDGCIGDADE